jgi:hypothetical protein
VALPFEGGGGEGADVTGGAIDGDSHMNLSDRSQ